MRYTDIYNALINFENYQIPQLRTIISNYLITNPDKLSLFTSSKGLLESLLSHFASNYDSSTKYSEATLLELILDYMGLKTNERSSK